MSKKAPTLKDFERRFPTEESCLDHLMRTRFGERLTCFKCQKQARYYRVKARLREACESSLAIRPMVKPGLLVPRINGEN